MFSTLRTRFGIPGVISVMALVFAMFGGAYAASNSSGGGKATASAKAKQGPRGKTGKTGPAGPAGPAGPTGPAGAAGAKGDNGANGSTGAAGTAGAPGASVTVSNINVPGEEGKCVGVGGAKFVVGASKAYACNGAAGAQGPEGPEGSPWTAGGKLPTGATETGSWVVSGINSRLGEPPGSADDEERIAISFSIPLAAPLDEDHVHYVTTPTGSCTGSVDSPTAAPGHLCVYEAEFGINTTTFQEFFTPSLGGGASTTGVIAAFRLTSSNPEGVRSYAAGSWAVTG